MTPKQMGRLGLFHIEEAIIEVLSQEPEGLRPGEISNRIGIGSYSDERMTRSYAIVHGTLVKLKMEGVTQRVDEEDSSEYRWQLQQ